MRDPWADWQYCLLSFIILKSCWLSWKGFQKAIKKIPYVKLHFRQDKLDVWGNVLIKYSRNNESLYSLLNCSYKKIYNLNEAVNLRLEAQRCVFFFLLKMQIPHENEPRAFLNVRLVIQNIIYYIFVLAFYCISKLLYKCWFLNQQLCNKKMADWTH